MPEDERRRHGSERGLTLVETLVAMAVIAAVSMAAFALLSQGANFAASERDRIAASIVADNLLTEELLRQAVPDLGEDDGETEISGRFFEWSKTVTDAGEDLRRIEYKVRLKGFAQTLARAQTVKVAA